MNESYINDIIDQVNKTIRDYITCVVNKLCEASYHLFTGGGKRLRPLILVASSDLLGGERQRALKAGAAVEILHNFTLIHDDIMDNDTMRRGLPTVHVKYGVPMAILAGDFLHALAFKALNDAVKGLTPERIYAAFDLFTKGILTISEGQAMDMEFEGRDDVREDEYLDMIYRKTAALFMVSAGLGGIIAGGTEDEVSSLQDYGKNLGLAFQIVDDILGLIADEKELGKPVYSDIREGKKTILVIKTFERASSQELEVLKRALGNRSAGKEELSRAAEIIKSHSLEYAYSLANKFKEDAVGALGKIKARNEEAKSVLLGLTDLTVKRRK